MLEEHWRPGKLHLDRRQYNARGLTLPLPAILCWFDEADTVRRDPNILASILSC
jgi:hypothetical protein